MTLKQQHKTEEMATNDTKIGCNNATTSEKSANTIYSKMPGFLLNMQNNRF